MSHHKKSAKFICDCGSQYKPRLINGKKIICETCLKKLKTSDIKKKAVEYLGGKCSSCGASHIATMEFDHKNPEQKQFKISGHYILQWSELVKELRKCQLLCANCHRIKHYTETHHG